MDAPSGIDTPHDKIEEGSWTPDQVRGDAPDPPPSRGQAGPGDVTDEGSPPVELCSPTAQGRGSRGGGCHLDTAVGRHAPPPTPSPEGEGASRSLPALADPLPDDPDTAGVFTRARQVVFLEGLATSGAVRSASASAGVSYRTAYRERRASPAFRRAWDAALLSARAMSEDVLATRAIEGVEEEVWYHGEVVATRRRYDSRLLLAHLARLDKLTQDARTRAFADDYEGALERFAAGVDDPAPVCGDCGEALPPGVDEATGGFAPGQCDKCDTPLSAERTPRGPAPPVEEPCPDCGGACLGFEEFLTPADCQWLGNRLDRMKAARPAGAMKPHEFYGHDFELVELEQMCAFEKGVERWWLVIPPDEDSDPNEWRWYEE